MNYSEEEFDMIVEAILDFVTNLENRGILRTYDSMTADINGNDLFFENLEPNQVDILQSLLRKEWKSIKIKKGRTSLKVSLDSILEY